MFLGFRRRDYLMRDYNCPLLLSESQYLQDFTPMISFRFRRCVASALPF